MNEKRKLQARQSSELEQQFGARQTQGVREFGSVEEVLRFDAARSKVPPSLTVRLQQSLAHEPAPRVSWWRRLFG